MDNIANLLTSLKNASRVKKDNILVSHSKIKESILSLLKREGFIKTYEVIELGNSKKQIKVVLEYVGKHPNIYSKINDIKRISKLSQRIYLGYRDIPKYKFGRGLVVVSTPKGIMTGTEAKKELVGGEVLFNIW